MTNEWDISDEELDAWLDEWDEVDREAADYLAERVPEVTNAVSDDDARWLDALAETISPSEEPREDEIELVSAVMALQHADWLGLALGVVRRGPGDVIDPELVQADVEGLDEVEAEIDEQDGFLEILALALLHLTPQWQRLGVLDEDERLTDRGVWGLPRAVHRTWAGPR